jgi:hypothetical protein
LSNTFTRVVVLNSSDTADYSPVIPRVADAS